MPGDEWQPKIDTYLDGEPPTEEMRELDAHVRSCRSCAAEVLNRLQLKRVVQASAAKCYLPTAICQLPFANCHLLFAPHP